MMLSLLTVRATWPSKFTGSRQYHYRAAVFIYELRL